VRVVGAQDAQARQVLDFLADQGLFFGSASADMDVNILEYRTRRAFPELRFVGIRIAGVRATVTVAKAMESTGESPTPGRSVVASRAGMIVRITPVQGMPRVQVGDVVASGQLLIEGVMEYTDGSRAQVAADGQVMARVWITASASGSLTRVQASANGTVCQQWSLILGSRKLPVTLGQMTDDMVLEKVRAWRLPGFAADAPLALEMREYRQGELVEVNYDTLLTQLKSQAGAEALYQMPSDGEVLERQEHIEVDDNLITVTTTLQVLCNIAQPDS
jgi:sporulation protein YqfD